MSRCARRSISACNARAASTIARSRSTWRPTRPSSCRTITQGRLRPRAAYSMGLIFWWARLAELAPGFANAALSAGSAARCEALARIRTAARAAGLRRGDFQEWWRQRAEPQNATGRKPVILWPDTFNNHFLPARRKRRSGCWRTPGYRVIVPEARLCCGRPLYDYGMLDLAKRKLLAGARRAAPGDSRRHPGRRAGAELRLGVPRRDGQPAFRRRGRAAARRADQDSQRTVARHRGWKPPKLDRKALLHMHCHTRAVLNAEAEHEVLQRDGAGCATSRKSAAADMRARSATRPTTTTSSMQGRRAGPAAGGSRSVAGDADHRRRLQLPRADSPCDEPLGHASGRGPGAGAGVARRLAGCDSRTPLSRRARAGRSQDGRAGGRIRRSGGVARNCCRPAGVTRRAWKT